MRSWTIRSRRSGASSPRIRASPPRAAEAGVDGSRVRVERAAPGDGQVLGRAPEPTTAGRNSQRTAGGHVHPAVVAAVRKWLGGIAATTGSIRQSDEVEQQLAYISGEPNVSKRSGWLVDEHTEVPRDRQLDAVRAGTDVVATP